MKMHIMYRFLSWSFLLKMKVSVMMDSLSLLNKGEHILKQIYEVNSIHQ